MLFRSSFCVVFDVLWAFGAPETGFVRPGSPNPEPDGRRVSLGAAEPSPPRDRDRNGRGVVGGRLGGFDIVFYLVSDLALVECDLTRITSARVLGTEMTATSGWTELLSVRLSLYLRRKVTTYLSIALGCTAGDTKVMD